MRQLTVIMFTDVVGYSSMMQRDEPLALRLLEEHWVLVRALLPSFGGTEIKTIGDAFLLEFSSVLSAVKCAVEIQRQLHERNLAKDSTQHIVLRIGIHLGDVERRDGDLFGDGVNVAARLEGQAPHGGICVSETVYAQVRTQGGELAFKPMGQRELKNISLPLTLYSVVLPWQDATGKQSSGERKTPWRKIGLAAAAVLVVALGGWLVVTRLLPAVSPAEASGNSVAVLPFVDMSPEHDQEYFSDGLAEQLLDQLAKVSNLRVAARTSAFSFKGKNEDLRQIGKSLGVHSVLEGSVRKSGDQIRVTAQLIDVSSGYHIWSETYDRQLTGIFQIQDDISGKVVEALKAKLLAGQVIGSQNGHVPPVEAFDLILKARHAIEFEDTAQAIALAQQALVVDPQYALALCVLAQAKFDWADGEEPDLARALAGRAEARALADKAVAMDPGLAAAYAQRGVLKLYVNYDAKGAVEDLRKALEIAPADIGVLAKYVDALAGNEELGKAVEAARKVVQVDPLNAYAWTLLARYLLCERNYAEAEAALDRALQLNPTSPRALGFLTYFSVLQGKPVDKLGPRIEHLSDPMLHMQSVALIDYASGDTEAGDKAMQKMIDDFAVSGSYQIAEVYAILNRKDEALHWLERAYDQRDGGLAIVKVDIMFANLQGDPRFDAFKKKLGHA